MQFPQHHISVAPVTAPGSRTTGLVLVGLLHIALVYAIVAGLVPGITRMLNPVIDVVSVPHDVTHTTPAHPTTRDDATFADPRTFNPTAPTFEVEADRTNERDPTGIFAPDAAARAISATHTSPPYPSLARRLGQQGKVLLKLTIGADGTVSAAVIERSSGSDTLDEAAIAWVTSHWHYQPAQHAGAPVVSTTEAVVEFDLKNG
jgi:protein TonB